MGISPSGLRLMSAGWGLRAREKVDGGSGGGRNTGEWMRV